ncbi:hypothetical protein M438DRAFT_92201 [Aureobasidium pullulans EXF-150]|uniref:Uncharacterized protein n=1 Tax=Aureobasidium pullulans EXF-150 TaxID=1043002 RepID=A0A074YPK2_AURPU|nr:uncharacterized protein M438DRAFT_92201 [Aureobasidium pullulans EXF-150]KEQ88786.1 hypothetical protein M438DRAFT_92201 [Aureobasidium pullulans EXF-150]
MEVIATSPICEGALGVMGFVSCSSSFLLFLLFLHFSSDRTAITYMVSWEKRAWPVYTNLMMSMVALST